MLSPQLLQKVRQIELATRRWVDDALTGRYRSQFKGQGVTFSEHREYVAGDDVRHIDWKVSARSRDLLIRKYEEERELVVFLLLDLSASEEFGSRQKLKSDVIAEVAGLLAMAAARTGDKVGALLFDGDVQATLPPRKGKIQVFRVLKEVLGFSPRRGGTAMGRAIQAADRVMKHKGIVFVVSDFRAEGYELELRKLVRRHDVILIDVSDPGEANLPQRGEVLVQDPETGSEYWLDLGSRRFQTWWEQSRKQHSTKKAEILRRCGADSLSVQSTEDYAQAVVAFLKKRARIRSRR